MRRGSGFDDDDLEAGALARRLGESLGVATGLEARHIRLIPAARRGLRLESHVPEVARLGDHRLQLAERAPRPEDRLVLADLLRANTLDGRGQIGSASCRVTA